MGAALELQRRVEQARLSMVEATADALEKAAESIAPVLAAQFGTTEEDAREVVLSMADDEIAQELARRVAEGTLGAQDG